MPDARQDRDDLAIALTYYSPYVSGLTNMARDIAEGLAARGRTVTVVTSHFDSGLPLEEEINGVRVLRAPVLARVGRGVVSPQLVALGRRTLGRARVASLQLPMLEAGAIAAGLRTPLVLDLPLRRDAAARPGQRRAADRRRRVEPAGHAPLRRGGRDQRGLRAAQPHVAVDRAVDARRRAAVPGATARAAELPRDRRPAHRVPRPDRPREGPGAPRPRLPGAARPGRPPAASAATTRTSRAAASSPRCAPRWATTRASGCWASCRRSGSATSTPRWTCSRCRR